MTEYLIAPPRYQNTQKVSQGTTLVAFKIKNGILMVADSRTSSGQLIENRAARKIEFITQNLCVACSGASADTRALCRILRNHVYDHELQTGRRCQVGIAAHLLAHINFYYRDMLQAGLLVCGVDDLGFHCFKVMMGGTYVEESVIMSGSGSTYIMGLIRELYKEDMELDEALELARKLVRSAVHFDGSSGGLLRWVVIGAEGSDYWDRDNFEVLTV